MALEIRRISRVTPDLGEAFGRLLPQLAPGLSAPEAERLRAMVGDERTALFAAVDGGHIVGLLALVWYDVPSGRKAWVEDVAAHALYRKCGFEEVETTLFRFDLNKVAL